MTAHVSIRFLIGLHSPNIHNDAETVKVLRTQAVDILSRHYEAGAVFDGTGFWKGESEPCITFETIQRHSEAVIGEARRIAAELRSALEQDAIGLAITPTVFELI